MKLQYEVFKKNQIPRLNYIIWQTRGVKDCLILLFLFWVGLGSEDVACGPWE